VNRYDYLATGPRMGLQGAVALARADLLSTLHLDAWIPPQWNQARVRWLLGPRAHGRVINDVPRERIRAHPQLFVLARARRRRLLKGNDATSIERLLIRTFGRIASRCSSPAVFGMQSSSLELFAGRETRVMEQFSPPLLAERMIAHDELRMFPGWAHEGVTRPTPWDQRMVQEWEEADIVWVPSPHLVGLCDQAGADASKFRVVRYPVQPPPSGVRWKGISDRPLRVAFAGTLMLAKGVQYIYEALRGWNEASIEMHFFGPIQLTSEGVARLAEVGTVHGPVSRAQLLQELARSDLLLFPSLSEGSALVTAEAASLGLPVVATPESGGPASAVPIAARDPAAIRAALETFLDERVALERASAQCLAEAQRRTLAAFHADLADLAREPLARGGCRKPHQLSGTRSGA
jgi:glycosyltransferase involved in cell wall biosynthesis